jgi:hypothetical protein
VGTTWTGRLLARIQGGQVQMYLAITIAVLVMLVAWLAGSDGLR